MAAEAILSVVLEQLASITIEEAKRQISLVGDVDEEVDKLRSTLQAIQAVLFDAEQRQVKEQSVRFWLDRLKDSSYDMEDVLDEWSTQLMKLGHENVDLVFTTEKKVCFFFPTPCFGIKDIALRHDIALKIKEINEKLDVIAKQKDMFNFEVTRTIERPKHEETTSFVDVSDIYGRDYEKETLVNMLLSESSDPQQSLRVISIVGMGGIGKTTLAQLAYKDDEITRNFHKKIWVCASDPFETSKIAKGILESFKRDTSSLTTLESLLREVRESIVGKKFFLVLDDVWTEDYNKWEPLYKCLKDGLSGSKILVTTRKETVARTMNSYLFDILNIKELSKEECWSLFKKLAFFDRTPQECEALEEIGRKIINKCKGLPLAAKTMGSLLRHKKTKGEWQLILDDEMWKLESFERGIFPPLLLSYNDLPPMVKLCFLYCAIFPKDWVINRNELIYLLMAQGYLPSNQNREMEIISKEYFDILASRSFFQEFKNYRYDDHNIKCKMHDIVHDVALFLSRNECLAVEDHDFEKSSVNFSLDRTCHLMVIMNKGENSPIFKSNLKKLRSLLICDNPYTKKYDQFPLNMEQITHLRTLKLRCHLVKEIPREITKLVYLKFLHLIIGGQIKVLPDTICELYNLQTLRIENICSFDGFIRLPLGMEKLIKLRHLSISSSSGLVCMPKGIEKLTCLQTLTHFIVNGSGDDNNACTLEALKNLNQLRGCIRIKGLGSVKDASEIKKAELWNKKNLVELRLEFNGGSVDQGDHEILLKAFQPPPPNLEVLWIYWYEETIAPLSWMLSFSALKKLVLFNCSKWKCLPTLGNLPYLESLWIGHHLNSWNLDIVHKWSVRRVSNEFLGVQSGGASSSSSSSSSSNIVIFPKLKSLKFSNMTNWEEWDFGITRNEEDITIMPHLQSLKFLNCPKLKVLPEELFQRTTLEELKIEYNPSPILKERFEEWSNKRKTGRLSTSNQL